MKVKGLRVSYTPLQLANGAVCSGCCLYIQYKVRQHLKRETFSSTLLNPKSAPKGNQRKKRRRRRRKVLYVIFVQATIYGNYFYYTSRAIVKTFFPSLPYCIYPARLDGWVFTLLEEKEDEKRF
jgi:hypothetical protein